MADTVTEVLNNYDVYTGVWTNWAKGGVAGVTVTTTTKHGALLIAFLALYVQVVGTRFWRILCFAFHQSLSRNADEDGFYHQRQVVLRNVGSDYTSLFEFLRIGWAWRGRTQRSIHRVSPLVIAALTHITLFAIAGIFSSYVTNSTGNEVLLANGKGGFLNGSSSDYLDTIEHQLMTAVPYTTELAQASTTYAQQCYNVNASSQACATYVRENIKSSRASISCPFGGGICLDDLGIQFDSGPLNSQFEFGINAKPQERFTWRVITTCAVIKTEGYTLEVPDPDFNLTQYPLQEFLYGTITEPGLNTTSNSTYSWHNALSRPFIGVADYIMQ